MASATLTHRDAGGGAVHSIKSGTAPPNVTPKVQENRLSELQNAASSMTARSGRWQLQTFGQADLKIDLTLTMKGFYFEDLWSTRRTFTVEGQPIPVARAPPGSGTRPCR